MKKLLNKIEIKPLLISIGLILFQTIFFFSAKLVQSNFHLIGGKIDNMIKFNILAIIPYCLWYILIFYVPYYFYKKDKNALVKYIASYLLCAFIASIIFVVYPTTVDRPIVEPNGVLGFITWFIFKADTPAINCLPSLHCAVSMLLSLAAFSSKKISMIFKIIVTIFAIIVMISTLYIKQHVFIDLVTGDVLATLCFLITSHNKKILSFIKKLLKI